MTMRMSARAKFFLYLFLIFMVILTVIPLLYTVSASFKTNMEIATGGINLIPKTFTFDNYKTVWSMSGTGIASKVTYTDYTINSIKVSLMTVVLVVLFTSMSAYCFQRGNFPGQKFLYWLFMGTMFIGAGTVTMFPLLRITTKLGLNNLPGLALVQFGTAGASNLFLTMGALMTFRSSWNNYLLPNLMLARDQAATTLVVAVVKLQSSGGAGASQYNLMMAGTMLAMLPMLILFLCMNKMFVEGITQGAVKG